MPENKKGNRLAVVFCLALLFSISFAAALGIRPAKTALSIEEGRDYLGQFWVVNNEGREFSAKISAGGEMGQYVKLHTSELAFRSDDSAKAVDFEVHLPETVPPGESKAVIIVEEDFQSTSLNVIGAKLVLKYDVLINGPYPEKYLEVKLNFYESGPEVRMVSEVENKGKKDIGNIQTTFYVNDKNKNTQSFETGTASLKTKESALLDTRVDKSMFTLGEFDVAAVTTYDGQKIELTKKLVVGEPDVDVTYFEKYFIARQVNQYSLELLNKWNQQIENVFVDVAVRKDGQKIGEFRTRSVDLDAELSRRINDYVDARSWNEGKYTFDLLLNFFGLVRVVQKPYTFPVELLADENALGKKAEEPPKAELQQPAGISGSSALWWKGAGLAAITLLLLLAGYIGWRYRHREEYESSEEKW